MNINDYLYQEVRINILDADTKELIQKNFLIDGGPLSPTPFRIHDYMQSGTGVKKMRVVESETIVLDKDQVTAFGYNYSSITGNVIKSVVDPVTSAPIYPWVVNIYIKKK